MPALVHASKVGKEICNRIAASLRLYSMSFGKSSTLGVDSYQECGLSCFQGHSLLRLELTLN